MAEYNVVDPDDLIECPYEKSHMIRAKRFQYHLMKCRKNYVGRDYATCPFNARHEMPKPELRYHIANCADKVMIAPNLAYEKSKQGEGTYFKGNTDVPDYDNFVPESEENWEEEIPSVPRIGVDPSYFARLDNSMMSGLTPREKRAMKNQYFLPPEERRLDSHLQNEYEEEESEEKEEKLRLPQSAPKTYLNTENKSAQQPSTVFAYSLSMAGIGRGQPAHVTPGSTNPDGGRVPEINRYNNGLNLRGRGGRGIPLAMRNPVPSNPANMNDVFSMGIGRGRGLMGMPQQGQQPGFVMPHLGISSSSELLSESTQNGSKEQDYKSSTESESSELADLMSVEKERKKLQKKLRQIEQLESKEGKLSKEEMEKVRLKQDILDRLQRLN